MSEAEPNEIIRRHLDHFFVGHAYKEHIWPLGPALTELPNLRVYEFAPGPKTNLWVYATIGAWGARNDPKLEFVITAAEPDQKHVELLFMSAWYHKHHCLGTGHTLPIGRPWLPGSTCEFLLVSTPYPFGPDLEVCNFSDNHVHFLWLLPITSEEREFKVREGLEALEQRFDECAIEYWIPNRASAIVPR
jgi:hypothetical protein